MNEARRFSDEQLNAFVDNQLGAEECEEILAAVVNDGELSERLCALRSSKEFVRHAYGQVPLVPRTRMRGVPFLGGALAAGVALIVGILVGWLGHQLATTADAPGALAHLGNRVVAQAPARILIHLDNDKPEQMDAALELAETYLARAGDARIEIIANNRGLDLLRNRTTPFAKRIAAMKVHHEQLGFIACGQTIARLRGAGEDVSLVPEAVVTRTAIEHVAERVQEGWTYLKI